MFRYPDKPASQIGREALDDLPGGYIAELKMDGWRCQIEKTAGGLVFTTRHRKPCPVGPEVAAKVSADLAGLPVGSILDAEWLARRPAAREEAIWLFDIMQHGDIELYGRPAGDRLDVLYDSVPAWLIVPHSLSCYAEFFDIMHSERADAEGVVLKRVESRYIGSYRECANNPAWIKSKWRAGEDGQTLLSVPHAAFTLAKEPAARPKPPEPIRNNDRREQRVLLTGLHCLSGQADLFDDLNTQR